MKKLLLILCCSTICLSGCTMKEMFGAAGKIGQVIWDPSTPIGSPDDQPSQVTISILATDTINPNPNSVPVIEEESLAEQPLSLTLTATTPEEMREQLRLAIDQIDNASNVFHVEGVNKDPNLVFSSPKVDDPFISASGSGLPPANEEVAKSLQEEINSQTLTPVTEAHMVPELVRAIATPVTLRVLQLKDDSMFLSADFDSLNSDIKQALGSTYVEHDDYVLNPGQFKYIPEMDIDKRTRFIAVYAQFYTMDGANWKSLVPINAKGRSYNLMISINGNTVTIQPDGSTNK